MTVTSPKPAILFFALLFLTVSTVMAQGNNIQTESGLVLGVPGKDPSIIVYKGIPYAAPPVGELRWRPPQPPLAWNGVRKADRFGDICPQMQRGTPVPMSEDCLSLNIWTAKASTDQKRPVFVWIYGGRFVSGAGSEPLYDGEGLARKGLIVVTLNYSTGVFGFLATPELSKESGHNASGNYGLLDQIAALQWVRKNIAAFGGDPNRVTIAGQSAGAASVLHLVNSPLAKGLFHRAIAESGARFPNDPEISGLATSYRSLKDAEQSGVKFAKQHGANSLKELRALSVDQLLVGNNANDENVYGKPPLFRPVFDGWVIPRIYAESLASGLHNDVPIMTGNNLDESGAEPQPHIKLNSFINTANAKYGPMAKEFLKLYPASSDAEAGTANNAAARDSYRVSTFLWAIDWQKTAKSPVYTYFWTHLPPGPNQAQKGAYHGSEINYVFNNLYATNLPWTDQDRKIAEMMSSYWANFAATGDPNGNSLPGWAKTNSQKPVVMELGNKFEPIPVADPTRISFIKRFFTTQKSW